MEFTSNKKNLTCSLWDGTGPFYLQYFPRGDYYTLSCTPQSDIFELSFTDGNITEYIAFETQDYYTISYSNSSQLIQIDINEDMARMKNSSSYKVAIYNQTGSLMKQVSMANKTISINISYTSWITQVKRSVRRRYQSATNLNKRKGGKHYPSSPLPFLFPSIHAKRIERSFAPPEQFRFFRTRGINEGFRHDNPLVLFIEMGMADKRAAHHVAFHLP